MRVYANPTYDAAGYDRGTGDQVWDPDRPIKHAQQPVVDADGSQETEEEDEHGLFVFDEGGSVKWSLVPDAPGRVARLDATPVEGTVYGRGTDRLLAIRSEAEREDDTEEQTDEDESEDDEKMPDDEGDEPEEERTEDESEADGEDDESDDAIDSAESAEGEGDDNGVPEDENDDAADDDGTDTGDNEETDDPGDSDATDDDDDDEGTPGFTTGVGIAGGALGLEWLRRRGTAEKELQD